MRFGDLSREYAEIRDEIDTVLRRVLERGWFVLGPEVEAFEREFGVYCDGLACVGTASGTDAIALALRALEIGPGDQVLTASHTAIATAAAISMVGAVPCFVDCRPDTGLMDVAQVERAIGAGTRAIIPVHLYGQCVDMDPLLEIAGRRAIPVVEDCAQAHGAMDRGRKAGTMGTLGCYSFYPSKNLGCYGDGGAVVTADRVLASRLRRLRNYGQRDRYVQETLGINSRLDEMQAAILRVKLRYLDRWNDQRRRLAATYSSGLAGLPLETPVEAPHARHVYHLYVVQAERRDALQAFLDGAGIQTLVHYPVPIHLQRPYVDGRYPPGTLPATERVAQRVLSLPLYPQLPEPEAREVIRVTRQFFG